MLRVLAAQALASRREELTNVKSEDCASCPGYEGGVVVKEPLRSPRTADQLAQRLAREFFSEQSAQLGEGVGVDDGRLAGREQASDATGGDEQGGEVARPSDGDPVQEFVGQGSLAEGVLHGLAVVDGRCRGQTLLSCDWL